MNTVGQPVMVPARDGACYAGGTVALVDRGLCLCWLSHFFLPGRPIFDLGIVYSKVSYRYLYYSE